MVDVEYPVALPPNVIVWTALVPHVHVYVTFVVFDFVIVVPDAPVPLNVPPFPQSTVNVPAADIVNWKELVDVVCNANLPV